ncbi:ferric reductase transmembrane component 4, partial [Fusarium langsethiae]
MRLFTGLSLPETLILALFTLPFTASATELLQGYGRNDYALPCAQACTWATPTTLDCPEYAAMSAEERAVAYPSATCMGNDTWYLTSIAWCITSYCSKDTKPYKIEIFWGTKMIYQVQSIKFSYGEALAQVDTKTPPKPMSPDEAVLNRTISIDDASHRQSSCLLLRLTNWSYSTFILLHRWVAMVCVVQVILHSLMWLQIMVEAHSHAEAVTYPYWQWGIVGTVAFSLLLPFSILPFRRALYEVFLVVHICLAVVVLVGSWYHIWYLFEDTSGFEIWLIIAIAVWGYERLLRILRISRNGIKKAYITKVDEKYLQIDIPDMDAHGHCFVYFPWRPWENHPFSIVNCSRGQLEGEVAQSSSSSQVEGKSQSPTDASLFKEVGMVAVKAPSSSTGNNTIKPGITL